MIDLTKALAHFRALDDTILAIKPVISSPADYLIIRRGFNGTVSPTQRVTLLAYNRIGFVHPS